MRRSIVLSLLYFLCAPLLVRAQAPAQSTDPTDQGAAGESETGFGRVPLGAEIAIIVIISIVAAAGIGSAILFYMAKKRQWEIRKSIRRSARRLTGNFNAKKAQRSSRHQPGVSRLTDDKSARKPKDLEKGTVTTITSTFDLEPPTPKPKAWHETLTKFGRKTGR